VSKTVILVPGLWAPRAAMVPLALRLRAAGLRVRFYRSAPWRRTPAQEAARLAAFAAAQERPCYIGHSYGGVLVYETLAAEARAPASCALLLGAPVRGSASARWVRALPLARRLLGAAAELLCTERSVRWNRPEPLGLIAGTRSLGLGRLGARLAGPNDGVVRVLETEVEGATDRLELAVSHTGMLLSARVAAAAIRFLHHARFGTPC